MPFTNDSDIFDFTKNMRPDEAIVIFQNVSEGTWPKKLNYTIRMKTPFKTHMTTAMDGGLMPHQRFGAMYEPFMRLQWAIDTSYIQILTGKPVEQNVVLQEFPYVKFSKSDSAELVTAILFPVCWLSLFVNFVFLMTRLLQERASGIQELMKMMGVSTNVLGMTHVFNVMGPCLVYSVGGTILLKTGDYTLLEKSNGFLIFFALYSHFFATIAMAFACSYIAKSTQYIITLGTLAYVVLWAPANLLYQNNIPKSLVLATGFLPYAPMGWIWAEIGALEKIGQGLTFTTMMSSHTNKSGSAIAAMTLLGLQAVFFFALAWYFDHVRPGRYGHALPWDFLLQRSYWVKNNVKPDSASRQLQRPASHDERYFEPPGAREVGISVHNVTKMFPKQRALNDVSLDVYKGEITILLGHNGAGKTTLMSIITGMIGPTSGKVLVNGLDMSSEKEAARQHIGLCPQHNLFFPDLTVLEHVMFFTLLKGSSFFEARISSLALLDKLGIKAKADNMSDELSGGMKRRLQLACALAGNARVLILDEPTSGLDVETRRELWDLLLSLRGSRTVLLSTHFMEEADALGDRVAALHAGQLRCHATPMYLKRALGTGYRLTFTTIGQPKEDPMTNVIQSIVPDAAVKETTINSISYNLPAASSKHFPSLFTKLESQRSELGIDSIGVGITTLEEVFLRLCSDVDTSRSQDELDGNLGGMASEPTFNILSGPRLYIRQILMLMKRQLLFLWYKRMYFFSLQVLIPVLLMCTFTLNSNNAATGDVDNPALAMNLDVYKDMPGYRMLYNLPKGEASLKPLDAYPNVKFEETGDVNEAVLNAGRRSVLEYNQYLAGVELNDTEAKVMYTTLVRHAAPSALNLLTNLLAARVLPWAGGKTLTTINHPLPGAQVPYMTDTIVQPKAMVNSVTWGVILVFVFLSAISGAASLPCRERVTGARHIHIMAGCPAELHWAATLLFHTLIHATTLIVPAMIICAALDDDKTFTDPKFIMCLGLSLVLGLMAFLALTYLVSFYFQENGTGGVLFCSIILFVLVMPMLKAVGSMKMERSFSDRLLSVSSAVAPPHTLVSAVLDSIFTARHNTLCNLNRDKCPVLPVAESDFDIDACCTSDPNTNAFCYFCLDEGAPGKWLFYMFGQIVILMTLVFLTQRGLFKRMWDAALNARYAPPAPRFNDEVVRAERAYVEKAIELPDRQIADALLASDIHKRYRGLCSSCNAVKGVSFSVKKGECFGLLGVNGAGKSSMFQVLTGEQWPTRGRIFANGQRMDGYSAQYLRGLGYCPQFSGLDEFLTGRQNLNLLLALRGLCAGDAAAEALAWINVVGLQKYIDRKVIGYSGGCVRRLAAAAALCNGAPLTLLDEPTSGVDVSARRRVWAALRRGLKNQRSIIITSHSMDEMEALCTRICIMSAGEACALGSPAGLRARHAAGHAVLIKVRADHADRDQHPAGDEVDSSKTLVNQLKGMLQQKFNCTLKDEHKTMLHYHINETMQYSSLFQELEQLKASFPTLVEDYSVTETTLEEVFLSFAKPPPEPEGPARPV
ncbi:phospholipid-transporting ATPase ABCA3-like [Ostrinia nubilalis]|uniref:phospholipid-transporting ATPase ABCA3-like n=1 Tax=Ostrinia nubilalis TaxID=29057 RepID=UPI00308264ED